MTLQDTLGLFHDYLKVLQKKKTELHPMDHGLTSPVMASVLRWLSNSWNLAMALSCTPFLYISLLISMNQMGANPIEAFHLFTGIWSLRLLCLTLMVTPLQILTGWRGMASFRQLFGLMAFFYAALHVYGYVAIDHGWMFSVMGQDILETPYLWPGILAFVILLLLAVTSPKAAKRIMGKNWKKLHRWIYPASLAIILHYLMQLKGNLADPLLYGVLIGLMLLFRLAVWIRNRSVTRLMIPRARKLGAEDEMGG